MVGLKKAEAGSDTMMVAKKKKKQPEKQLVVSEEVEWGGISADV